MNQTHRDQVKDPATKRREYLLGTTTAHLFATVGAIAAVGFGILTVIAVIPLAYVFYLGSGVNTPFAVMNIAVVMLLGVLTALSVRLFKISDKKLDALNYVPPVREQVANLPADEVLLRGSNQPTATPEELLRSAQAGIETDAQELLRAEQVRSDEQQAETLQVRRT